MPNQFPTVRDWLALLRMLMLFIAGAREAIAQSTEATKFVDHSLLIAPEFPCTWPSAPFPRFQITHQRVIGPDSAYNIDVLLIDGNTGTQLDVPPHSVARPDLKREKSGPLGSFLISITVLCALYFQITCYECKNVFL